MVFTDDLHTYIWSRELLSISILIDTYLTGKWGVCSNTALLSWIFHDFGDALKHQSRYLLSISSFLITYIAIKKIQNLPCATCNIRFTVAVLHPLPLNQGLALIMCCFRPTSSTNQKHSKLCQCLEIDNRRSLSKFVDVRLPSSQFHSRSLFYREGF